MGSGQKNSNSKSLTDILRVVAPILVTLLVLIILYATFRFAGNQMEQGAKTALGKVGEKILKMTETLLDQAAFSADFNADWLGAYFVADDGFKTTFNKIASNEIHHFDHFGLIYFGDTTGNHWMHKLDDDGSGLLRVIERLDDSPRSCEVVREATLLPKTRQKDLEKVEKLLAPVLKTSWYKPDKDGALRFYYQDAAKVYDPRLRPWYQGAVQKQGMFWTDVYTWDNVFKGQTQQQVGITVSMPVFRQGKMVGVTGIDLVLQAISKFLGALQISPHGRAFIFDSSGLMVGLPDYKELLQKVADGKDGGIQRVHIRQVRDPAMVAAYAAMQAQRQSVFGQSPGKIPRQVVGFLHNNESYISFFQMLDPSYHLDWTVGVLMPEMDVKGPLQRQFTWILAAVVVVALFFLGTIPFYMKSEKDRRFIHGAFSKYVSPNRVNYLLKNPEHLTLGGSYRICSFVMTDLMGFTSLMEQVDSQNDPEVIVSTLNEYLEGMVNIAFRHEGTLDRIVGDAVAVLFSAPVVQADHARRAVACALEMNQFATEFSRQRNLAGMPFGRTRIGVNTGRVLLGNFGGKAVFDYRALGDPINTAARLESVNNQLGTQICVSQATVDLLADFHGRPIGNLVLKGKENGIMAFEPLAVEDDHSPRVQAYKEAYALMVANHGDAEAAFARALARWPDDPLLKFHHTRLVNGELGETIIFAKK